MEALSNIDNLEYERFLSILKSYSYEERLQLLNNIDILNKLFLLDNEKENIWLFQNITSVYNFKDLLPIMKSNFLNKMVKRSDRKSYVYLITFIRNNKEEFMEYIFTNEEFLNFFLKEGVNIYSELEFSYDFIIKLINYSLNSDLKINNFMFISLIENSIKSKEEQMKVLEDISDHDLKVKLLTTLDKDVISNYLKNNLIYLKDDEIYRLMVNVMVPQSYFANKDFFIKEILEVSIPNMLLKIEKLAVNNNVTYLKDLLNEMVLNIINSYKKEDNSFKIDGLDNVTKLYLKYFFSLNNNLNKEEQNKKLMASLVIFSMFNDSIRNVCLNIYEMLEYNKKIENGLSKEKVTFYENILGIFDMDSREIYEIYEEYHDKFKYEDFYDDMRFIKDISYQNLKDSCLSIEKLNNKNNDLSLMYGCDVYELMGEDFTSLVSCQRKQTEGDAHQVRKCYSLISQNNMNVFNDDIIIYGYTNFPWENVIHMLESDAGSFDTLGGDTLEYVNRIRTPEELLSSNMMNEIQIANIYNNKDNTYKRIMPSYIICFDEVNRKSLIAAKEAGIPIVIIYRKLYRDKLGEKTKFLENHEFYSSLNSFSEYTEDSYGVKKL